MITIKATALTKRLIALFKVLALVLTLGSVSSLSNAAIEVFEFDNPRQEAQYQALIEEFRCPKCQNQNLAGSDSVISQDLKRKTYEMVMAGQSDAQIREYMYERYGDFISYKPPVRPSTWILWYFPPVILLLLIAGWLMRTKKANNKKQVSSVPGGAQAIDLDKVGSNLSDEEAQKLKALLKEHSNDNISDKK
ncbi:cytochrome c-type biogenesis protein [Psychrobacter sp. UBA3962]|uniref:cytochrome c-type biogenesis protein n=1 Tax=Psychrobacter sp. UBA3962 TaxID=1947352 RepID=UPI0025D77B19|nr:cytochrome c-type biogenesis protein [Psychrobacter sp. UBA3962]